MNLKCLHDYTDDELQAEIERRSYTGTPVKRDVSADMILEPILDTVQSCLDSAIKEKYWDEDNNQYIFEAVMEAMYGGDYFEWHNKFFP